MTRELSPEEKREAEEFARNFSEFVNRLGAADMHCHAIKCMLNDHRTLIQSMTRFMTLWFRALATLGEHGYDLRNEASVMLAKEMMRSIPDNDWILPRI